MPNFNPERRSFPLWAAILIALGFAGCAVLAWQKESWGFVILAVLAVIGTSWGWWLDKRATERAAARRRMLRRLKEHDHE